MNDGHHESGKAEATNGGGHERPQPRTPAGTNRGNSGGGNWANCGGGGGRSSGEGSVELGNGVR
jgi:hypothetical protein